QAPRILPARSDAEASTAVRQLSDGLRVISGETEMGWRPEVRLGTALRRAREERGLSLRALAKLLYRAHSNLVEYERGHRLAPLDVVKGYEAELGLAPGELAALHEDAQLQIYGEDRSRRRTYVLKPPVRAPH